MSSGRYVGLLTYLDLLVYVAYAAYFHTRARPPTEPLTGDDLVRLTSLQQPVERVLGLGGDEGKKFQLLEDAPLQDAFAWGLHRILIVPHVAHTLLRPPCASYLRRMSVASSLTMLKRQVS